MILRKGLAFMLSLFSELDRLLGEQREDQPRNDKELLTPKKLMGW
jgi:hypothetical protein